MKVIHVIWGLTFGGVETMLVNIANEQCRIGAKVTIIIINDLYEEILLKSFLPEIKIVLIHRKIHSKSPVFIFRFNRVLQQVNPDIIHLHSVRLYGIILNRRLSRIACTTLHDSPTGSFRHAGWSSWVPIIGRFKSSGNVVYIDKIPNIFAISRSVKDELKRKYGVDSHVVLNGIKTAMFQSRAQKNCSDVIKIIMVSRLEHQKKGHDLLIEAMAKLKGKADVSFVGVGNSMDYLKKLSVNMGCGDFVHFLGKKPQDWIAGHLKDYDLFCQPSRWEGFGLTVAEAMAAQLPVLVSSGQGPAEVTCGETYGWIFENGNVDDLAEKIAYISSHYMEALSKAIRAREYVKEKYDVKATAKQYLDEYQKIILHEKKS